MLSVEVLAVGCVVSGDFFQKQMVRRHYMSSLPDFEMLLNVALSQGDSWSSIPYTLDIHQWQEIFGVLVPSI